MAGSTNDTSFINPANSGFPAYLDFTTLRSNAINYLGPITGKYWTDYNVHDPGITTLEVLLYAIMDLGYRTNLPIESLLAGAGKTNFFTPAQVFGCNPTSVLDYRKLLMDIDEVRNAWLEPDQTRYNGIYKVYLETEKGPADFSVPGDWKNYRHHVRSKVRKTLAAFRNLCEDFGNTVFLKRTYIGVNVDIEIAPGTDTSVVYQQLVATLYDFFSPVPTFYTLAQLTANDVSLDTVFAGRPYTGRPSHGFLLDGEMPDRPGGEQTIYKSALVQKMLGITGIRTIRMLALLDENGDPLPSGGGKWEYPLAADTVPAFSLPVSAFRWYQNGQLLSTQLGSYNAVLQLNALHSGKVIYPADSPALDMPAPNAEPLTGLGNYYSIQNDYPLVYGIGQGGLPVTSSTLRQSQALQLKGYLLFFDQVLADYLGQLSNIGQLFAMNAVSGGSTYFGGDLGTVPDVNRLLRFPPTGAAGGATLLYPVASKDWETLIADDAVEAVKVEALSAYTFGSSVERDTALATVTILFSATNFTVQTIQLDNGQWKYYLAGTDDLFVLVSQNSFASQTAATGEATTVLYIGAFKENYSLISLGEISSYSFNLVASSSAYYQYLQSILEDPKAYTQRRAAFVEHLLSRFAEAFTDYAMLEAGFASADTIADKRLDLMQRFLGQWPVVSADRGKAFDYRLDGWNSSNISGLEKRFKDYCGIADMRRHDLCHFEVQKMEEHFHIALSLAGGDLFTCTDDLLQNDAFPAVYALSAALSDRANYRVVNRMAEGGYRVEVNFYGGLTARSVRRWLDEASALTAIDTLYRMWQVAPAKGDSQVSAYQYRAQWQDHQGRVVRTAVAGSIEEEGAYVYAVAHLAAINDESLWTTDVAITIGELCQNKAPELPSQQWIDVDGFKIYTRQDVLGTGKARRWSFEVLDGDNSFRFESRQDFETQAAAREACCQLLHFLCEPQYYSIRKEHENWYKIVIRVGDAVWAEGEPDWDSETHARERIPLIVLQARQRLYTLRVISLPHQWKFSFYLGLPDTGSMVFESVRSFDSQQASVAAARAFHQAGPNWEWREAEEGIYLVAVLPDGERLGCFHSAAGAVSGHSGAKAVLLRNLLEVKKDIYKLAEEDQELAERMTSPDETSKEGAYVYRLVDKDHPRAFHPVSFSSTSGDEAAAMRDQLIAKAAQGYVYLELSLGDDVVRTESVGGVEKFYFRLRCRNDYFSRLGLPHGRGLVLFESIDGYDDAGQAQTAFQQTYLAILRKAGEPGNYGPGKYIALSDRDAIADDGVNKPVVLVPARTREAFEQAGLMTPGELVKAALSYPIRLVEQLMPRYRWVLRNDNMTDWASAVKYPTAADARAAFDFFLLLLNFPGNYFIEFDWKICRFRLGIREVLAESTHRFHDEREAWGPRGVEKFICVAQHPDGFHLHRREDCSYSWFIACPNRKAIHPCMYETAAQRDQAMHRLVQEAGYFFADGWIDQPDPNEFRLLDGRAHPLAVVPRPSPDSPENRLNRVLDIADALWAGAEPERYGSGMQLIVGEGAAAFAISPAENWSEKEWMRRLSELTTYFPITREATIQGGVTIYSYRLEMKLPGFEDPPVASSSMDCGCPPVAEGEPPLCYLAWKDTRDRAHAVDAWKAWLALLPVIADKSNYRPVFGEDIGCYGIELLEKRAILARNPQLYAYSEMAVESVGRAKERIDAEGLDIVEHLLLRPDLGNAAVPVCGNEGPCSSILPFQPGADPYSFILTVALPAWPARFRKSENRVLLESILQREMPAHILARILWLTPRDMCRFERLYAGWIDALGRRARGRESCHDFKPEKFIEFLFETAQACLPECRVCEDPVEDVVEAPGEEQSAEAEIAQQGEWLDQINRLYCWKDRRCAEKWDDAGQQPDDIGDKIEEVAIEETKELMVMVELEGRREEKVVVEIEETLLVKETPDEIVVEEIIGEIEEIEVVETGGREDEPPHKEIRERVEKENLEETREEAREKNAPDARTIRRLQSARRSRYEQRIAQWKEASGDEKLAENAGIFLVDPNPSTKRLEDLLKEIMKGRRKQSAKGVHRQEMAEIVLSMYLDRISMETGNEEKWEHLGSTLKKFNVRLENPASFYKEWRPEEMWQLAPGVSHERLESLMREIEKGKE